MRQKNTTVGLPPHLQEDDDDIYNNRGSKPRMSPQDIDDASEELNKTYGFRANTTVVTKVTVMYEDFGHTPDEIADILGENGSVVARICEDVEQQINDAGRSLSEEEANRKRGLHIRRLEKNIAALQARFRTYQDEKVANLIANMMAKLSQLQGLEDKPDDLKPTFANILEESIAKLDPARIPELRKALQQA